MIKATKTAHGMSRVSAALAGAFLVVLALATPVAGTYMFKSLAGTPDEFQSFQLPTPASTALESTGCLTDVFLTSSPTDLSTVSWTGDFPCDSDELVTITVFSPIEEHLSITIHAPALGADPVLAAKAADKVVSEQFGIDGASFPSTTYVFLAPAVGVWTITVAAPRTALALLPGVHRAPGAALPQAWLQLGNKSPYLSFSHVTTFGLVRGAHVGVQAQLFDDDAQPMPRPPQGRPLGWVPTPLVLSRGNMSALLTWTDPSGGSRSTPMYDDGAHDDLLADDGVFGASLPATENGIYLVNVRMLGSLPSGVTVLRSTEHQVGVVEDTVDLAGTATGEIDRAKQVLKMRLHARHIALTADGVENDHVFKVWAEVWGVNSTGADVPIAWVGGLNSVLDYNLTGSGFELSLPLAWVALAGAQSPFTLRTVRVQDRVRSIPIDTAERIPVLLPAGAVLPADVGSAPTSITEEMRSGPVPSHIVRARAAAANGTVAKNETGRLVLVHGYCALYLPWPAEEFPGALTFERMAQDYTHDEFARAIIDFVETNHSVSSYSIVAHSQGGAASLTLLSYYWSGLDVAVPLPGQTVQSVGTPYQGCSMAGDVAAIGKVFGQGCGKNTDLTTEGAQLWLPGIPPEKRQLITFYRAQYKNAGALSYCNLGSQAVSKNPNDGVAEVVHALLPGGVDKNVSEGECHSIQMKWPAETHSKERNKIMYDESTF